METQHKGIQMFLYTVLANYSEDIMQLISRLSFVASKKLGIVQYTLGSWSAHPIVVSDKGYM